jgi:HD superfamily phosphohydrolase
VNKKKIFNDPVYGFITIPTDLIYDIIEHPIFQRLRRIKQLGLTDLVYPGALHTRFHHALGAMHLMSITLDSLRNKGNNISDKEYEGALLAILLHDIGHGPFSHSLETSILPDAHHEELSVIFMEFLNKEFDGQLTLAIEIFNDKYDRKFLHELISSQLDIDRLDYLNRDSYFTGVAEGIISSERIIKLLDVVNDRIVVEEKGIYSIENFLNARRLMYWQVYLHKTTISAEEMLISIIKRARHLAQNNIDIFVPNPLKLFLETNIKANDFREKESYLKAFTQLDDYDVFSAIKQWTNHSDFVLSFLSSKLIDRKLFKVKVQNKPFEENELKELGNKIKKEFNIGDNELQYILLHGVISNEAYISAGSNINIVNKKGEILDIADAADLPNITAISKKVKKHYLSWPKSLNL